MKIEELMTENTQKVKTETRETVTNQNKHKSAQKTLNKKAECIGKK